jgi:hypothetical protein
MKPVPSSWLLSVALAALAGPASAADLVLPAVQTGGFYASGAAQNLPAFQNYFVGYGTSPGLPRTPERRSFFVFDLPPIPGAVVSSATLTLRLPFGGLIYGKGPGTPGVDDPIPSDSSETFAVGLLPVSPAVVLSPSLTLAEGMTLFALMDDLPAAPPTVFTPGTVLIDPGDGGGAVISIALDGTGLAAINAGPGLLLLSGWMPSWSEDFRLSPTPPPLYFESSELIFGLTDVHVMPGVLNPTLELTLAAVPELPSWVLGCCGAVLLRCRRQRRH